MRIMLFGLLLFVIYGCSQSHYAAQQSTVDDFLKALQSGHAINVKKMLSPKVDSGIDSNLLKNYVRESSELLNIYGLPERHNYKIVATENDPIVEFDVPILDQQQHLVASINILFIKGLPPNEIYTFVIDQKIFEKRMIEEPKQMQK